MFKGTPNVFCVFAGAEQMGCVRGSWEWVKSLPIVIWRFKDLRDCI